MPADNEIDVGYFLKTHFPLCPTEVAMLPTIAAACRAFGEHVKARIRGECDECREVIDEIVIK
jgi:hypothetical protein